MLLSPTATNRSIPYATALGVQIYCCSGDRDGMAATKLVQAMPSCDDIILLHEDCPSSLSNATKVPLPYTRLSPEKDDGTNRCDQIIPLEDVKSRFGSPIVTNWSLP